MGGESRTDPYGSSASLARLVDFRHIPAWPVNPHVECTAERQRDHSLTVAALSLAPLTPGMLKPSRDKSQQR